MRLFLSAGICAISCLASMQAAERPWQHRRGDALDPAAMPDSALRRQLLGMAPGPRAQALERLSRLALPQHDLDLMRVDADGLGICIHCPIHAPMLAAPAAPVQPVIARAPVPIASPPAYHSKPGAARVIYLDFNGHVVSGTAWNSTVTSYDCLPFDTDSDATTFSDAEQVDIQRIWQRVAEDYAPFDVDVTTELPVTWNANTLRCLITRDTDAAAASLPSSGGGGVAYVGVMGGFSYDANQNSTYSPAFVYFNNLANREDYIAEAASHEIGHNMGLNHDGVSPSTEYYGGHAGTASATSWGPIMGTGYNQNVSQWSKGEYTSASNTSQDDVSIIAGNLPYRSDDFGNTTGTATMLTPAGGTALSSSGIVASVTDADVVAFPAGAGSASFTVAPWVSPANTKGGNLDVRLELLDSSGAVVASAAPTGSVSATITTTLAGGGYYLRISGDGEPTPPATGYTAYGSIGQWTLTGTVVAWSGGDAFPPTLSAWSASGVTTAGATSHAISATYADNTAIAVATLDGNDLLVTGPSGFSQSAAFLSASPASDAASVVASYRITPPGGSWDLADNGTYNVWLVGSQVADTGGQQVAAQLLGSFHVAIAAAPTVLYSANMASDPGWTLGAGWAYGTPTGGSGDPTAGATGTAVLGTNLAGAYARSSAPIYAVSPAFSTTSAPGGSTITVAFQRWLRVRSGDVASLATSPNGTVWTDAYTSGGAVADSAWSSQSYDITSAATGRSAFQLRFGLLDNNGAGGGSVDGGWNIDDVVVQASVQVSVDSTAPTATATLTAGTPMGGTSWQFTVAYSDASGIAYASLDGNDVRVTSSGGYSQLASLVSVDQSGDGTPRTATYQITPPGGSWDPADNGTYTCTLVDAQVRDTASNHMRTTVLGSFTVNVSYPNGTGTGVTWERWDAISGTTVASLTGSSAYAGAPSATGSITSGTIQIQPNLDNYGLRMEGVFVPPVSGTYYFTIASDDSSELWVSTDGTSGNATLAASVSGYTSLNQWNKYGSQRSSARTLVGGSSYFVRALLKEGTGGDFVQVGVELPGGVLEQPAPYHRFNPVSANATPTIDQQPSAASATIPLP